MSFTTAERPATALDVLKDNFEAFAIAIVMALVIKHFCVEAFRIPTGSMEPTLLGEDGGRRDGDRILVDKFAYLFHGPERWDVIVFRYPLDQSRNFVKRVAGLPGETIRIRDGDLWIREAAGEPFHIAVKRRSVREELYFGVYPPATPPKEKEDGSPDGPFGTERWWHGDPENNAWRVESLSRFEFGGGPSAALVYAPAIGSASTFRDAASYTGQSVRDVRVAARITADSAAATSLRLSWRADAEVLIELRLTSAKGGEDGSILVVRRQDRELVRQYLDATLEPGHPVDVELEAVDGEAHAWIDGREVAVLTQGRTIEETWSASQRLALTAEGGALRVEGLRIHRDLAYTSDDMGTWDAEGGLRVPADSWFMLGDNTGSSSDSRKWKREGLKLKDGRTIWWDNNPGSRDEGPRLDRDGDERSVTDVDGIRRHWLRSDEVDEVPTEHVPFVRRSQVVGRAFFIFWPLFTDFPAGFPHRMRMIH